MEKKERDREKKEKNFYPTERDFRAVRWIVEQGIVTVEHVWLAIYAGEGSKSSKYAEERLRGLCQLGLIKRVRIFGSGATNYVPCIRGLNQLPVLMHDNSPQRSVPLPALPRSINLASYSHRIDLNACRVYIQRDPRVPIWVNDRSLNRYSEMYLKDDLAKFLRRVLPDAYFRFNKTQWFLECERTQKSKKKYEEKNEKYRSAYFYEIRGVVFVVPNEAMKRVLKYNYHGFEYRVFTYAQLEKGLVMEYLEEIEAYDLKKAQKKREYDSESLVDYQNRLSLTLDELKEKRHELKLEEEKLFQKEKELKAYSKRIVKFEATENRLRNELQGLEWKVHSLRSKEKDLAKSEQIFRENIERLTRVLKS